MKVLISGFLVLILSCSVFAREGMWLPMLLEELNEPEMKSMGFELTAEDIYSINNSSIKDAIVHFGGGCTAEVISDQGLILTNHHCGYGQIQSHSSLENDYLTDGFWAMNHSEELTNPGLTATFIDHILDVTQVVYAGVDPTSSKRKQNERMQLNIEKLREKTEASGEFGAVIKPFYYGNKYYMIVTKTFHDVRLVGAPPSSVGKFGGDPDNWMWPRHTGDFSIFRIYADKDNKPAKVSDENVPYKPLHSLPISLEGVHEGDFAMIYGFPGRTQQYLTSYAVDYVLNVSNPAKIAMRETSLNVINAAMQADDKTRIQYASKQARISNYHKKWIGESRGLRQLNALEVKRDFEKEFLKRAETDKQKQFFELFEEVYNEIEPYNLARDYFIEMVYYGPEILRFAHSFAALEDKEELTEEEKEQYKKRIEKHFKDYNTQVDKDVFKVLYERYHKGVQEDLQPNIDLFHKKAKGDVSDFVDRIYDKTIFTDKDALIDMIEGYGKRSFKKLSKDPAFQVGNQFVDNYEEVIKPNFDLLNEGVNDLMKEYMAAMMELFPEKEFWPDANSTLRLSYGKVEGSQPYNGMAYKPFTTADGILQKYIPGDRDYDLPEKLVELVETGDYAPYDQDGELVVCFTSSLHTTGGNSGSPVINGKGHLIGLNFDRSWESTMSDIMFDPDRCRNIAVDARYILFIVDKFAGAGHLIEEMELVDNSHYIKKKTSEIRENPDNVSLYIDRAALFMKDDKFNEALQDYKAALNLDNKHKEALQGAMDCNFELGAKDEYQKLYRTYSRNYNEAECYGAYEAKDYFLKENYMKALEALHATIALNPGHDGLGKLQARIIEEGELEIKICE